MKKIRIIGNRVSQKIKSAICLSADLSIFLANLSIDLAGAKIRFHIYKRLRVVVISSSRLLTIPPLLPPL